jgi:hypothetical protein
MSGKLLAQARLDAQKFVTSGGFEVDITLSTPDANTTIILTGLGTGRWVKFDNEGNSVNSAKNSITISEKTLNDLEYPVRSEKTGKVKLYGHKVSHLDSNGTPKNYVIEECYPNGSLGLIICILGDSE